METQYNELLFDNRSSNDLFETNFTKPPFFADVIKRWFDGNKISDLEEGIVETILILDPKYVLKSGRTVEFIKWIRYSLKKSEFKGYENPEKGLFLYTLFYFLLKTGKSSEALQLLPELEEVFIHYNDSGFQVLDAVTIPSLRLEYFQEIRYTKAQMKPDTIRAAYFDIISLVMDSKELLELKPDFNLDNLPVPGNTLPALDCIELRSCAISLFLKKEIDKAMAIYQRLLIEQFELPGTLTHMARVELSNGNFQQVEFFTEMAWRLRGDAPLYVLARILWFKLCLGMLQTDNEEKYPLILDQLKEVLQYKESMMKWSMEPAFETLQSKISEYQFSLLTSLVDAFSYGKDQGRLDEFHDWRDANPTNRINQMQLTSNEDENTLNIQSFEVFTNSKLLSN